MERLTERDDFGNADIIDVDSAGLQFNLMYDEFNRVTEALNKLATYEETGCTAEEILDLQNLAEKMNVCDLVRENLKQANSIRHKDVEILMLQEKLERSVELSCKVGDVVYQPIKTRGIISTYEIISIEIYKTNIFYCWKLINGIYGNLKGFPDFQLGEDVFLTQEEAEQALKEREKE